MPNRIELVAVLGLLVLSGSCSAQDKGSMKSIQQEFNERGRKELLRYMSLKTMFPDKSTRKLAAAAGRGDISGIEDLVRQGIDVNSKGTQNATPLYWALRNFKGFEKLLDLGADPNIVYGDGGTILYRAAGLKDTRFLRTVLDHGGDPNIVKGDSTSNTPIFAALFKGGDAIDILLDNGANINAQGSAGSTPAQVAANRGGFDIVYHLLERGADPTIVDYSGQNLASKISRKLELMDPNHELYRWMERVIEVLENRGMEIEKKP